MWQDALKAKTEALKAYRMANEWRYLISDSGDIDSLPPDDGSDTLDRSWKAVDFPFTLDRLSHYWLRTTFAVPDVVQGIPIAGSACALRCFVISATEVYLGGRKVFSENFWSDFRNPEVIIAEGAVAGQTFQLDVHVNRHNSAGIGPDLSVWIEIEAVEEAIFQLASFLHEMEYCRAFPQIRELYEQACREAARGIDENRSIDAIIATIGAVRDLLQPAARVTKANTVHLVAHAHIDMNWLWTMHDTIDVCRRDFTTMTSLMKQYPDFHFSQSQVAAYAIAEERFPELFEQIQHYVRKGNWDVTAATWTEGDLNMANGESIVRHLLYARLYLQERFDTRSRVGWEPDTFGHPASIPQLLRLSGIDYYYHMRCGDGHSLYRWRGADGSELLAFCSRYNNTVNAADISVVSSTLYRNHGLRDALFVYGVGDHGGGPTRRDLERAVRLNELPGMPSIVFSSTHAFFDAVAHQNPQNLPVTAGEMNPIFQGCYTSHADMKRAMRLAENRLLEAEAAGLIASLCGLAYPGERLRALWRSVMFNQFHDIFDGCSIHATYERAVEELDGVSREAAVMVVEGLAHVCSHIEISKPPKREGEPYAVWNLQGFRRTDVATIPLSTGTAHAAVCDAEGVPVPSQVYEGAVYFAATVPSYGYRVYTVLASGERVDESGTERSAHAPQLDDNHIRLDGRCYELAVHRDSGCISHLYDKKAKWAVVRERDLNTATPNFNNLFSVNHEAPHRMSAWVIGPTTRTDYLIRNARVSVTATGPVMDVVRIQHAVGRSEIDQSLFFYKDLRRIDFRTSVLWDETSSAAVDAPCLRVSFRPDIGANPRATYAIPFGSIERPADGTEYPGQQWVDMQAGGYGIGLLNDCKYGFRANGSTLSMTCIRTSYEPDPVPDKGRHEFAYALLPHTGAVGEAGIAQEAAAFNSPLIPVRLARGSDPARKVAPLLPAEHGWFELEGRCALISGIKKDEGQQAAIVRLYETCGSGGEITIRSAAPFQRAQEVAPTEDRVFAEIAVRDGALRHTIRPSGIHTYRLSGFDTLA